MDQKSNDKQKVAVATLSVVSNSFLVIAKLVVGLLIGSVSVMSEAIHSGMDLVASVIALFSVSKSSKPKDEEHPFGHGKLENISGTAEALLIFIAAIWIIYEAVKKLIHPTTLDHVSWGVGVMLVSSVMNLIVSKMLFKVGRKTNSMALIADAWHLRTDVWTAAGVMVGLALLWSGEALFPTANLHWIDPVAAIMVAMMIFQAAYKLTIESGRDLLDARLPQEEVITIEEIINRFASDWCDYHDLRTRRSGATRFVEFHLLVDPAMTVERSHEITDLISNEVTRVFPETDVTIHIEPCAKVQDCQHLLKGRV